MSSKQLAVLAGVLLVLAGLVYWKTSSGTPPTIQEEVNLVPLVAEGIAQADITKLELHNGGAPDDRVVLTREADDPDAWRITSQFDAPAKTDTIEAYVEKIVGLQGESRSRDQDDAGLANYNLTEEAAFQVAGYKQGEDAPAFTILVGKSPSSSQVFMRTVDSRDVYVVDVNLRQEAGVYADDDPEKAPEPGHWLNKEVASIEMDTIDSISLETSEKRFAFEQIEKTVEPEESVEGESEDEAAEPVEPVEPIIEYEWVLKGGGPGGEFKQAGLDNWLRAFGSFNATDVVDPETLEEWGLDAPAFKIVIGVKELDEDIVFEAGHPDAAGPGYARIVGGDGVVYSISKYNFERVFPKGTDLFDLPALTVAQETINRIELRQPEGNVVLEKTDEEWSVTEPLFDLNLQTSAVSGIAAALAAWRASDYADAGVDSGLEDAARSVTFSTADGESHTVTLGNDSVGVDGAYAHLDDSPDVLVMSRSDINRVFKQPKDFYELTLLDIFDDEIQAIEVDRPIDGFELVRDGDAWTIDTGSGPKPAITSVAEDMALAISNFQASNVLKGTMAGIPTTTLIATMNDGTEHRFTFRALGDDSKFEFVFSGKELLFEADAEDVNELLPASDTLAAPEPEPETEETAEGDDADPADAADTPESESTTDETAAGDAPKAESATEETVQDDTAETADPAGEPAPRDDPDNAEPSGI